MKMLFRGWGREVKPHTHKVAPVMLQNNRFRSQPVDGPLQWHAPLSAYGKVSNLGLSGAFLVEFTFEEQELRGWLEQYAKAKPAEALRLVANIQAEATIALAAASAANSEANT